MNSLRKRSTMFVVLAVMVAIASPALAKKARYTITGLGILDGKLSATLFGDHSINNGGEVVGHCYMGDLDTGFFGDYFTGNVAFYWTKQTGMHALPLLPGAPNASAYTLNDRGQVIGIAGNSYLDARLVLWDKGTVQACDPLPGDTTTYPQAINNRGQVVGFSATYSAGNPSWDRARPILWYRGQVAVLPMAGYWGGQANDITDDGQIAGFLSSDVSHYVPAYWDSKGNVTVLPSLGGDQGLCFDLNGHGQIVGNAMTPDNSAWHAVYWDHGAITDLGTLGGTWGSLWGMNSNGQAVGNSTIAGDAEVHATLVENGVMVDLNDLIPADSGWQLVGACGINEHGQISGAGIHNGEIRSFILTPAK